MDFTKLLAALKIKLSDEDIMLLALIFLLFDGKKCNYLFIGIILYLFLSGFKAGTLLSYLSPKKAY